MHIKKKFIFIVSMIFLLIFTSCNQRPSPQEVAQFMLDIKNCNFTAVEKTIKNNKKILNIGYQILGESTMYPIYMAIESKNADMVKLIAKPSTVNIIQKVHPYTNSPLSYALSRNSNSEIIQILIETGADVNFIDELQGCNIFHDFCAYRNREVWDIIKEYATSKTLNMEDVDGTTPLIWLIVEQINSDDLNNPDIIYLLKSFIEYGGNPNYLIYDKDYAFAVIDYLKYSEYVEYKQVLLDGMKNSPPIEDSEILVQMLEEGNKE